MSRRAGAVEPHAEELGNLDGHARGDGQAHGHQGLLRHSSPPSPASGATTSRFHSRSEYSRANSRDSESRSPRRFTAMRKASSSSSPASSQVGHLASQVVFEFIHVLRVDGLPSEHVGPPFTDPFFQHLVPPALIDQIPCGASWNSRNGVAAKGGVDDLPLPPLARQLLRALVGQPVVLPPPPGLRPAPRASTSRCVRGGGGPGRACRPSTAAHRPRVRPRA